MSSMSIMAVIERYRDFIPALACVEKRSFMLGGDKQNAIKDFVDYLWSKRSELQAEEVRVLEGLKERVHSSWLELYYKAGKSFTLWEGFNWNDSDYLTLDFEVFQQRMKEHKQREEEFKDLAWTYIQEKVR